MTTDPLFEGIDEAVIRSVYCDALAATSEEAALKAVLQLYQAMMPDVCAEAAVFAVLAIVARPDRTFESGSLTSSSASGGRMPARRSA